MTRADANLVAATWMAEQDGFDEVDEYAYRLEVARARYTHRMTLNEAKRKGFSTPAGHLPQYPEQTSVLYGPVIVQGRLELVPHDFKPSEWEIRPLTGLWDFLAKNGVKVSHTWQPTQCPLCTNGPVWVESHSMVVKQLATVAAELADDLADQTRRDLVKRQKLLRDIVASLQPNLRRYYVHQKQFGAARLAVAAIQRKLRPGQGNCDC